MEKFTSLRAIAAPLLRDNIDTDIVIRIERLMGGDTKREELGRYCCESWRYLPDGSENPDFLLNQGAYRRAEILLAGDNFGCGSSREGAVWALRLMGIRCVIAPSFGDIFRNNCYQNGVLPITMERARIEAIAADVANGPEQNQIAIDLQAQEVIAPDGSRTSFRVSAMRKDALLAGLDEVGLTLKREPEITAFQAGDRQSRPWIHQV
jgi:3-isopropylmalate/(R)-2-methylmalate dehydratase small subunit